MNAIRVTLCMAGSLALTGCSAVMTDYDPAHDFSPYASYRWSESAPHPADTLASDPLTKKRIVKAVDAVLREKGYVLAPAQVSDFSVCLHGTVTERFQIHDTGGVFFPYGDFGWHGGMTQLTSYDEGTVFIDVIDGATGELVWRGWLSRALRHYTDPTKAEAAAEKMVRQILRFFPPESPGHPAVSG